MSYTHDVCHAFVICLNTFSRLDRSQLAGHVENLDFWAGEAEHCIRILEGYQDRFERMKSGQLRYQEMAGRHSLQQYVAPGESRSGPPLKRGITHSELQTLHREIKESFRSFLTRCLREELLDTIRAEVVWQAVFPDLNWE